MAEQRNIAQLQRAENLLWIAGKPLFKAALDERDRTDKLYTERADRLEKRSGDLKNEIYQLVSFFTVMQGVLLTAVTQMAAVDFQFSCKKVWGPALLAGLAWFATSVGIYLKLRSIQDFDDKRANQNRFHQIAAAMANKLRDEGARFDFAAIPTPSVPRQIPRHNFWVYTYLPIVTTLAVFTGICIASYFLILCNRGLAPIHI